MKQGHRAEGILTTKSARSMSIATTRSIVMLLSEYNSCTAKVGRKLFASRSNRAFRTLRSIKEYEAQKNFNSPNP